MHTKMAHFGHYPVRPASNGRAAAAAVAGMTPSMATVEPGYTTAMTQTTTRVLSCPPQAVMDVLNDGWSYATWVVGASRIRDVSAEWPSVGSTIHHSVGAWPLLINDTTTVEQLVPGRSLQLRVRAWPTGEGRVLIEAIPHPDGCEVQISEDAVGGPAVLVPTPARDAMLHWRNTETLRRLAFVAEGRRDSSTS
ncbi:MAG: hypothetical protein AVDCRST_MAG29-2320 [uncultured Nocardioidaceae bacterium]|uniref:Polyketide cyclase/dehydrase n=1 Tax=uncultured Nocardioidaceae bacterium TaxID=253824 RepID=A0A6J4M956_9ACTN|nr:MAG: hypothetical protein AVDCRST_MAG29-2320 [uncultured Nocardioidaceae bacterium]